MSDLQLRPMQTASSPSETDTQSVLASTNESSIENYVFWSFKQCTECKHRFGRSDYHLIIDETSIPAAELLVESDDSETPFAISYTWGLLPHKKQWIGHNRDGDPYYLSLGTEWDLDLFLQRLVCHSDGQDGPRFGWLDQMSNQRATRQPDGKDRPWFGWQDRLIQKLARQSDGKDRLWFGWLDQKSDQRATRQSTRHSVGNPTALNQIPHIYRRCEVIALFPGSHCECLRGVNGQISASVPPYDIHRPDSPQCLNYINLVSWWTRLWPRQEFMYATRISIDWINRGVDQKCLTADNKRQEPRWEQMSYLCEVQFKELFWMQARTRGHLCWEGACALFMKQRPLFALEVILVSWANMLQPLDVDSFPTELRDVPSFLLRTLGGRNTNTPPRRCPCKIALEDFKAYQRAHFDTMAMALSEKQLDIRRPVQVNAFLLGHKIRNTRESATHPSQHDNLKRFWFHLGILSRSSREVTNAKDLVAAVWPECPGYVYKQPEPQSCQTEATRFLEPLEDGLRHLTETHRHALITTAPCGLFKNPERKSWEWVPKSHLAKKDPVSDRNRFPKTTSYVYGTMASPFVPVPILGDSGSEFLALEYYDCHQERRSLLSSSRSFWEKVLDEPTFDEEFGHLGMIRVFLRQVVNAWPKTIRSRCIGPQRLILETLLETTNAFITDHVAPKISVDIAASMALWTLLIAKLVIVYHTYIIFLLKLVVGRHRRRRFTMPQWLRELHVIDSIWPRQVHDRAREELKRRIEKVHDWARKELKRRIEKVHDWARKELKRRIENRNYRLYDNQPAQTARDQEFLNAVIRPTRENWGNKRIFAEQTENSGQDRVNYVDTVYYMVAEALGFRPLDLGLKYNTSWEKEGCAYNDAELRLVVSESYGRPPMLGLMSKDCTPPTPRKGSNADGHYMTVAFRDGTREATSDRENAGTCLYEIKRTDVQGSEAETWRIVGVWVPVNFPVENMISGWFGPGARADGKLL